MKANGSTITKQTTLEVTSPEFKHEELIPMKFTCEGQNINPTLLIGNTPEETISLALIMDDPDAPGKVFDHWILFNISPRDTIKENSIPGRVAKNSRGEKRYTGPCPPSGTHRYFFKVYALDASLQLNEDADKNTIEQALSQHTIGYGELVGLYKKQQQS